MKPPSPGCKELADILGPPKKKPKRKDPEFLKSTEEQLGIELPKDYLWFISEYGAGTLDVKESPIRVFVIDFGQTDIISRIHDELDILRQYKSIEPSLKLPVFPSLPGLLTWGTSDQGHCYCWLVKESPLPWSVAYLTLEFTEAEIECSFCEFLLGLIKKTIRPWPNIEYNWVIPDDVSYSVEL